MTLLHSVLDTLQPEATGLPPVRPGPEAPPWAARLPLWHLALGLVLLYGLAALLSLYAARQPGSVASLWYANALAVAALAFRPWRDWPALLAGVAVAVVLSNLVWGDAWWQALAFFPANAAEVMLAAWCLQRAGLVQAPLRSARALLWLLLLGGVLPQCVGATLGAFSLGWLSPQAYAEAGSVWLPWFEGSVIGALSVLPLAWVCCQNGPAVWRAGRGRRWWPVLLLVAVGVALLSLAQLPFPFIYLSMPLLLAAMLVDLAALLALTLVVSITVALAMAMGVFVPPPLRHDWEQVFVYMAFAGALVPAQLLAAALAELRLSHDHLAQQALELRRANDGLEQFVRMASHDLREPLNTVQQFASLLRHDEAERLSADGRAYLNWVDTGAQRMRLLLDDVLQFVRQQRQGPPPLQPVALDSVLADVQAALAGRLHEGGGQVAVEPLPVVLGNATLLALVFQNLVANALKFMPPGRLARVQVRAVACDQPGQVAVEVADNGIGIAQEDLPRLFAPFQRLHVRRLYEGHGLGLALAQQLVQAQGGQISVASVPGEGSRFTVRLQAV